MSDLRYVQPEKGNAAAAELFENLIVPYATELDLHQNRNTPKEILQKWAVRLIETQDIGRHLAFCYDGDTLIGFLYGKTDRPEDGGFIRVGYGCIVEFYVLPPFRRKGYGTRMYAHLENLLKADGTDKLYLTADPVTGKPFWESLGFAGTHERSPQNGQIIYEKTC